MKASKSDIEEPNTAGDHPPPASEPEAPAQSEVTPAKVVEPEVAQTLDVQSTAQDSQVTAW